MDFSVVMGWRDVAVDEVFVGTVDEVIVESQFAPAADMPPRWKPTLVDTCGVS
jgi:hypothetical protein